MKKTLFDPLRKITAVASGEELVRQQLLSVMTKHLGYPRGCILVEKHLSQLPWIKERQALPRRRFDIICVTEAISPLLLIECKEGRLKASAWAQAFGYNYYVRAPYVCLAGRSVSGAIEIKMRWQDPSGKEHVLDWLPAYADLSA